jgi:hypothetical protein
MRPYVLPVALLFAGLTAAQPAAAFAQDAAAYPAVVASPAANGENDFDFNIGTWKVHMRRREHPLTGANTWTTLEGTVVVRKLLGGQGNIAEINVEGNAAHLVFLSLRLYNAQTHEWTLNFSSKGGGALGVPMVGHFVNGRADFYDQEPYNGRTILCRFSIFVLNGTYRDEQSFSADGGLTWEVNWINTFSKVSDN